MDEATGELLGHIAGLPIAAESAKEGGYANVLGDKGGETYMGISRVYWPSWPGWPVIDDWRAERINALPG